MNKLSFLALFVAIAFTACDKVKNPIQTSTGSTTNNNNPSTLVRKVLQVINVAIVPLRPL